MNKANVEELILKTPEVFFFSFEEPIEVTPGEFAPVFVNLKNSLYDPKTRSELSIELAKLIGHEFDHICGIESGGNYYVSAVADLLQKPLSFMRKEAKKYGDKELIVGPNPPVGSRVAILDDVFATGITTKKAVEYFKELQCKPSVFAIFSYCFENEIGQKMGAEVRTLTNFDNVSALALRNGILKPDEVAKLKKHISNYRNYI